MNIKEKMVQRLNDVYAEFLVNLTVYGVKDCEDCILSVMIEFIEDTITSNNRNLNNLNN